MLVLFLVLVLFLLVCLALAGAVIVYAAYVQRGLTVPLVPQVGDWMARAVERLKAVQEHA